MELTADAIHGVPKVSTAEYLSGVSGGPVDRRSDCNRRREYHVGGYARRCAMVLAAINSARSPPTGLQVDLGWPRAAVHRGVGAASRRTASASRVLRATPGAAEDGRGRANQSHEQKRIQSSRRKPGRHPLYKRHRISQLPLLPTGARRAPQGLRQQLETLLVRENPSPLQTDPISNIATVQTHHPIRDNCKLVHGPPLVGPKRRMRVRTTKLWRPG